MEHAKRLYLVDEFDRQYKELQRPPAAVAKTRSAIQLSDTLRNRDLDEHEKVRNYVAELHRYLNIKAPQHQQQQQQQQQQRNRVQKGTLYPFNTNTFQRAILPQRRPPAASSVTTRRQLKLQKKSKHADATETAATAAAAAAAEADLGDLFAEIPTATAYDDDDDDGDVFVFAGSGPSTSKKPRGQKRKKVTEAYDFGRFSRDWSRLATRKNK